VRRRFMMLLGGAPQRGCNGSKSLRHPPDGHLLSDGRDGMRKCWMSWDEASKRLWRGLIAAQSADTSRH
jgi:hypothetical protein